MLAAFNHGMRPQGKPLDFNMLPAANARSPRIPMELIFKVFAKVLERSLDESLESSMNLGLKYAPQQECCFDVCYTGFNLAVTSRVLFSEVIRLVDHLIIPLSVELKQLQDAITHQRLGLGLNGTSFDRAKLYADEALVAGIRPVSNHLRGLKRKLEETANIMSGIVEPSRKLFPAQSQWLQRRRGKLWSRLKR